MKNNNHEWFTFKLNSSCTYLCLFLMREENNVMYTVIICSQLEECSGSQTINMKIHILMRVYVLVPAFACVYALDNVYVCVCPLQEWPSLS